MARPKPDPAARAFEIIEAATKVFATKGFRRTQMADIAAEMKASPGTIYNAVTNKDALFEAVLLYQFGLAGDLPALLQKEPGDLIARIQNQVAAADLFPEMSAVLARPVPAAPEDFRKLLTALTEEQFDFMEANGDGVLILEKSTADFPALAEAYFGFLRAQVLERWENFLAHAKTAGHLAGVIDTNIAARSLIEVLSWWTIRMPNDPGTEHYDLNNRRAESVGFAVRSLTCTSGKVNS